LLTNAFTSGEVIIDSGQYVNGLCIELSPALLAETLAIFHAPDSPYPQKDFYDFLTTSDFFEKDHNAGNTNMGKYLLQATPLLTSGGLDDELRLGEFFYGLAEQLITDQQELYKYYGSFESVKSSTKKDLLRRLLKGKELMDDCYTEKISITEIARAATMSEYYFLRLFKKTFNCSPHRYLVNKRMQKADGLLQEGHTSVADIAYCCGFPDIHAFSKAYKKEFGTSPSKERKKTAKD